MSMPMPHSAPIPGVDNPDTYSQDSERIVDSYVQEGKFISERVLEERYVVGVKTFRVVEKIVEVPQVVVKEVTKVVKKPEIVERIIEKPKVEIKEVVKEIPIVKTIEKTVEVPEIVYEEKLTYVPKIVYEDRIIEIPKVSYEENITYEEKVEYREVVIDREEEEIVTEKRTQRRFVEKPIAMRMHVPMKNLKLPPDDMDSREPHVLAPADMQEVNQTVEVSKILFDEFPTKKKVPVPVYRMVFPNGTKKVANSIFGYPELPKPKSYLEDTLGVPFDKQKGRNITMPSSAGTVTPGAPTNLGVNANLVNTTRPPPAYNYAQDVRAAGAFGIPESMASGSQYRPAPPTLAADVLAAGSASSSVHPFLRPAAAVVA
ncbi:unnamed protein product [Amoebophrya sp. A25]|nr:unnamed protein product [Amoebophrya sp. A25]|eukprot:GSA25T00018507001.1